MMKVFYRDERTGIEAGINADGELFFGDDSSGYNLPDTPENREYIRRDFIRYTREVVA
jgi:hypothetical protein